MRAVVCHTLTEDYSGVGLQDVKMPAPEPGEVLVRVRATTVNFPDLLVCRGLYQHKPPLPFTPGLDVAGVVTALGEGVDDFDVGDAVVGIVRFGGFAEHVTADVARLRLKPPIFSFANAAAYPVVYLTAQVALVRRANLRSGETLLVHGAGGGTGLAAVDTGKALGATVIATASNEAKLAAAKSAGADHVIDVREGFLDAVKDITGGRGADVVFDPVGGEVFEESTRCIAFDGRLLVIGFTSGRIATIAANVPLIKGFSVVGVRAGEYGRRFPERGQEDLDTIWTRATQGDVYPRVYAELPLENFRAGFSLLEDRAVIGKVVLLPDQL